MLIGNQLAGFGARQGIVRSGLVVHLDADNAGSYPGSGQAWFDLIKAEEFFLGTTSGVEASDPTFSAGPPGRFSFDGGDQFQAKAALSGHLLRKIGRTDQPFTLEAWFFRAGSGDGTQQTLFCNDSLSANNGMIWYASGTTIGKPAAAYFPISGSGSSDATNVQTAGTWALLGLTGRGDGSTSTHYKNGAADGTFTLTNTWTTGDSNDVPQIGAINAALTLDNGARLAVFRAYDRILSAAEMAANFNAERGRFGV